MTASIDEPALDHVKRLGAHTVIRLERGIDQANAHMVSVSGWLTAALFALNGGGAVAVLNSGSALDGPLWPAGAFGLGLIFALFSAVYIQHLLSIANMPLENLLAFWRTVESTGNFDQASYEALQRPIAVQHRWYWVAPALGWVSGFAFIIGGTTLAIDMATRNPALVKTCARLQRDMLDPKQTGDRSRELFTTIGCRFAT